MTRFVAEQIIRDTYTAGVIINPDATEEQVVALAETLQQYEGDATVAAREATREAEAGVVEFF